MLVEAGAVGELAGRADGGFVGGVGEKAVGAKLTGFGGNPAVEPGVLRGIGDLDGGHVGLDAAALGYKEPALLVDLAFEVAGDAALVGEGKRCRHGAAAGTHSVTRVKLKGAAASGGIKMLSMAPLTPPSARAMAVGWEALPAGWFGFWAGESPERKRPRSRVDGAATRMANPRDRRNCSATGLLQRGGTGSGGGEGEDEGTGRG